MQKIIALKASISFKNHIVNSKENNSTIKPSLELNVIGVDGSHYVQENNKIIVSDKVAEYKFVFTPETLTEFIAQLLQQKKQLDESVGKAKLFNAAIADAAINKIANP